MKAKKLQKNGKMNEEELFWLFRNEVHAQRMSLYINAFHQYPEGVLTQWLHLQQTLRDVKKKQPKSKRKIRNAAEGKRIYGKKKGSRREITSG